MRMRRIYGGNRVMEIGVIAKRWRKCAAVCQKHEAKFDTFI